MVGPAAEEFFDPVPEQDLFEALRETLKLWNSQPDWAGDERNVVLTLSRIWYSAITGKNRAEGCRCRLGNKTPTCPVSARLT
uniref:Aminoglycoside 3''-nucleotidyltransferase n=1 Tax=Klebsiella pneumoniae TaxID=573 RepID=A0A8B0SWJ1_KLEPN|nr:Aminoglycoside 3''-nucleotidyltransferase [Klebsiella pneumoniae]